MGKEGSMGLGLLAGIVLIILIGWIPVFGALIAGLVGGTIARGIERGLIVGFVSGVVGFVLITIVFAGIGHVLYGHIGTIVGGAVGVALSVGSLFMASIGGIIGGVMNHRTVPKSTRRK